MRISECQRLVAYIVLIDPVLAPIDSILMLGAYGWAFVKPIRKLYYNISVAIYKWRRYDEIELSLSSDVK